MWSQHQGQACGRIFTCGGCGRVSCCGRVPYSATEILFFKQNPPVQACHSQQAPGLSHSRTFQPDWRISRSGSVMAQLFSLLQASLSSLLSLVMTQPVSTVSAGEHCPCVSATSYLFPTPQQLQASRSILVPLYPPFLAGERAIDLSPFQDSCGRPAGTRPGAAAALVLVLVPGTLPCQSNLLTI